MEGAAPAPPEVMAGGGQGGDGPSAQSGVELDFSMVEDSPGEARLSRMEASSAEVTRQLAEQRTELAKLTSLLRGVVGSLAPPPSASQEQKNAAASVAEEREAEARRRARKIEEEGNAAAAALRALEERTAREAAEAELREQELGRKAQEDRDSLASTLAKALGRVRLGQRTDYHAAGDDVYSARAGGVGHRANDRVVDAPSRAAGSRRVPFAPEAAESARDLAAGDQFQLLSALDVYDRPPPSYVENQEGNIRHMSLNNFAKGLLTPASRRDCDVAHRRNMQTRSRNKNLESSLVEPNEMSAKSLLYDVLLAAADKIVVLRLKGPSGEDLAAGMGDNELKGWKSTVKGSQLVWRMRVPLARRAVGGPAAMAWGLTGAKRLILCGVDAAELNYRKLIDEATAFERAYEWAPQLLSGGAVLEFRLWLVERQLEEAKLCTMLFAAIRLIISGCAGQGGAGGRNSGSQVARRFLFAHWLIRIGGALTMGKSLTYYIASEESPLVLLCKYNTPHSVAALLDQAMKGSTADGKVAQDIVDASGGQQSSRAQKRKNAAAARKAAAELKAKAKEKEGK